MKGELTISYVTSNVTPDFVQVSIVDELSGMRLVAFDVALAGFASAVTGRAGIDGTYKLTNLDRVGKRCETKRVAVQRPDTDADVDAILAPFEVDGWQARRRDIQNHHNWCGKNEVAVLFTRYVDPGEDITKGSDA